MEKRVFLIVLDSFGVGNAPDAKLFGDEGSNTLKSVFNSPKLDVKTMQKLGLFNIDEVDFGDKTSCADGAFGRVTESSNGKDTTIGHWEIAGVISKKPLPTYPNGFPSEIIDELSAKTGRRILCNRPYSGTAVINDFGDEHIKTGGLIVYTSVDSVLQIAAHEDVIPLDELYKICETAREILQGEHAVGRVIARPFIGTFPNFVRTSNRHDYSLLPPKKTMLDTLIENGYETFGIGKIYDIFAGQGIEKSQRTKNNADGIEKMFDMQKTDFNGLCFVNLVDFDMLFGHRNDVDGYANALTEFDKKLSTFTENMQENDIVFITADHGCDPNFKGTDHTRERVPLLIFGKNIIKNVNLKTRNSFADISATILEIFGIENSTDGESFAKMILKD